MSNHGYVVIQTGPRQRQYEHILVAEQALGRKLRNLGTGNAKTEVVHHVRGDKTDNKNLVICTHSYHTELHHRLEQSPAWPEFKKIVRNAGRMAEQ